MKAIQLIKYGSSKDSFEINEILSRAVFEHRSDTFGPPKKQQKSGPRIGIPKTIVFSMRNAHELPRTSVFQCMMLLLRPKPLFFQCQMPVGFPEPLFFNAKCFCCSEN